MEEACRLNKKPLIAMSGGVDSSVAAFLTKQQGFECIGATMKLFNNDDVHVASEKSCCSLEDVEDARSVALSLGMPYYVFNFTDRFKEDVIDRFVAAYENGATPNPCVDCNRYLKFEKLFSRARELDYDYVVTGHYARIEYNEATGRYNLKKAIDETKDQTYFLYSMTQEQLEHTLFPLGNLRKTEVRKIAGENGFVNAKKHDSQDICFVQNGKYADFIKEYTKKDYLSGDFVLKDGTVLGKHNGIIHYTIGQRKGLGISYKEPLYVTEINVAENKVVLGNNSDLFTSTLYANNINLISVSDIEKPIKIKAKVRYSQSDQDATVVKVDEDLIKIEFDQPQRAITKGQAVVLYDGDNVLGGGTII